MFVYAPYFTKLLYSVTFVKGQTFSLKYKNFSALYPSYMDKSRSIQKGGRRIAKDIAVEDPTIEEISLILQSMNIRHVIQPFKCYPRDVGFIPRDDNATGVLTVTEEDDLNESPEEMGEIIYTKSARGRILVDMAQAEERLIYQQQQQQQQKLLSNIDVDIPDMEENMQSGHKNFSKRTLLEEIARQISLLPLRDQRLHEMKRRNKKLMTLTSTDNQKKKQDPGKKKKK
jgi:signal recognition particle subunit SEC65